MHRDKHQLIRMVPGARAALQMAAQQAQITVDELVRAGLKRGGCTPQAMLAADAVGKQHPTLFASLKAWPYQCLFCKTEQREPLKAACPHCNARGCKQCVTGKGCPRCREEQERQQALDAKDQAYRETLLNKG